MTTIGAKEQRIVSDGAQGVRMEDIAEGNRGESSLTNDQVIFVRYLSTVACNF